MQANLSDKEKLLRSILGVYVMLLGFLFIQGAVGIIIGILGGISLATGMSGWCPLYTLLNKSSSNAKEDTDAQALSEESL